MPTIVISPPIHDAMVAHAREGAPEEVCGVLAGVRGEDEHRVEERHPAENAADRPRTRYEIDPREQLELMEAIEDAGREVVGFYHSHPRGPSGPSQTDAARAAWPDRWYVVVSLAGEVPSVGAWYWTGEAFAAEDVRVADPE